jgi:hypothetical protein
VSPGDPSLPRAAGHFFAILPDRLSCDEAIEELAKIGLGMDRVQVAGHEPETPHGRAARAIGGVLSFLRHELEPSPMPGEHEAEYRAALAEGRCVLAIETPGADERAHVVTILRTHGATSIRRYEAAEVIESYDVEGE